MKVSYSAYSKFCHLEIKKNKKIGASRELNPEPLVPETRIIPLDHQPGLSTQGLNLPLVRN